MNLFTFTRELIDLPSVSGDEGACARFVASYLADAGYRVELQEVERGRANVIATGRGEPRVFLSTHLDTVSPHFASREDEEFIYGRGACDAKGIIAAQIAAAGQLRAEGVEECGLLFTVDEELGSLGARAANTHPLAARCRYLINGEPTDNLLAVGSKGSLRLRIKAEGRAGHSAYPEKFDSAIEKLLDVLGDLRAYTWPQDQFFGETTCNIGTINGGTRPNVIPAYAEADLQIRLVTGAAQIQEVVERVAGTRASVERLSASEPVRMLAVDGFEQCIVRFTTDIPHLTNWGEPLLIGPGSILDAHTAGERIAKIELQRAVELYAHLIRLLLARGATDDRAEGADN